MFIGFYRSLLTSPSPEALIRSETALDSLEASAGQLRAALLEKAKVEVPAQAT